MGIVILVVLILSIIVFTTMFFLFKRKHKNPIRNIFYWILSIFSIPIIGAFSIFLWYTIATDFEKKKFDKNDWTHYKEQRYELVDDLINTNILIGLTKEELTQLLGQPENNDDGELIIYYLGYSKEVFLNMDPDWLEVEIENNKVKNVTVRY